MLTADRPENPLSRMACWIRPTREGLGTPGTGDRPGSVTRSRSPLTFKCGLIQQAMRDKGFSERSAISITKSVRVSTASVYDAKWKIFVDWCRGRQIDPLRTSVPQLAQILEHKKGGGA